MAAITSIDCVICVWSLGARRSEYFLPQMKFEVSSGGTGWNPFPRAPDELWRSASNFRDAAGSSQPIFIDSGTYFPRRDFWIKHGAWFIMQFRQGVPCSSTSHFTLRALQLWQAFPALTPIGQKAKGQLSMNEELYGLENSRRSKTAQCR